MTAPSGYRIEQAISAWLSARSRLLSEDADLANDEAALIELLGPEDGDVRDILGRLLSAAQYAAAMQDAAGEMVANLKARQERYARRNAAFRATIFAILDATGSRIEEFPHGTLSVSSGRQAVSITDEASIPDHFVRVEVRRIPDKAKILVALKGGESVDGAALANSLPVLTIRGK